MKIIACHLLNDYSGSPKVLMQLIKGWTKNRLNVTIVTSGKREGFLSDLNDVSYSYFWYKWSKNKIIRLVYFLLSQLFLFFKIIAIAHRNDIIYVNTVLPFGAALGGKLKGCRVIYHIHETSVSPAILKKFLFGTVQYTASEIIYVSNYLSNCEQIKKIKQHILYNAIEDEFHSKGIKTVNRNQEHKNILMICSLKKYKGVLEFIELARLNPLYNFKLVVNAQQTEVDTFFKEIMLPSNVLIYPVQNDTHPFYSWADIILNLSRKDEWIETFGLTVIEGMAYHLPAIVPPIGGIAELVENYKNGFLVDSSDISLLSEKLKEILNNKELYAAMKKNSASKINSFREEAFISKSLSILNIK